MTKEKDNDPERKALYTNAIVLALAVAAVLFVADSMVQSGKVPATAIPGVIVLMIFGAMVRFRRTTDPEERNRMKLLAMVTVLVLVVLTWLLFAGTMVKRCARWLGGHVVAGTVRRMPPDMYIAILLGPLMEYTRLFLAGQACTSPERAMRELASAAWSCLEADLSKR